MPTSFVRSLRPDKPTLDTILRQLYQLRPTPSAEPPRISRRSPHYEYALLIVAGFRHPDACVALGISTHTANKWRKQLRDAASDYFGRKVEYEFAAQYAIDPEWRKTVDGPRTGVDSP